MNKGAKFLGVIGCVVLAALLIFGGKHYLSKESQETASLKERAGAAQEQSGEDSSLSASSASGVASESLNESAGQAAASTPVASGSANQGQELRAISCRGDSFLTGAGSGTVSYPQALSSILQQQGKANEVQDYTWDMAGSLSQLYLAGIPEAQLDTYIQKHQSSANGETLSATELQLRTDRADKDLTRNDQNSIPVICMGYSGGWGKDLNELVEQIRLLIGTYSNQEDYVVMGITPDGWADTAAYNEAMSGAFGEHYLPLNASLTHPAMSDQGRAEIAQALAGKLADLKLI
jgi:hypothetical protein